MSTPRVSGQEPSSCPSSEAQWSDPILSVSDAERLTRLLTLLSDPTRMRMLFALVAVDELSVGNVARTLDITDDQTSYGLKILRSAGLVSTRREGRTVLYRLADAFPHALLEHCLRQLLQIAETGPASWR